MKLKYGNKYATFCQHFSGVIRYMTRTTQINKNKTNVYKVGKNNDTIAVFYLI